MSRLRLSIAVVGLALFCTPASAHELGLVQLVVDAAFLRHPEDARTDIVFRNPTPVDEFVLKFQKPM